MGPPNAGKSTLFNRLLCKESNRSYRLASEKLPHRTKGGGGKRLGSSRYTNQQMKQVRGGAIVSAVPGTTRDRRECVGRLGGLQFTLVDTAGVDGERIGRLQRKDPLTRQMIQQSLEAARQSDVVLLLFDAKLGITTDLTEIVHWLRRRSGTKEVLLLANKLEGDAWNYDDSPTLHSLQEASRLGFGPAIPISAAHGEGMADIAVQLEGFQQLKRERLGLSPVTPPADGDTTTSPLPLNRPLQMAILGRPNVGKSTLVNALLKQHRVLVGPTPGLTRDAIAVPFEWDNRPVQIVDTAGIRKLNKRQDDIEDMAVQDAMRAMKLADVAVLVLDAEARALQRQELAIADAVVKEGRSIVVVANKMDLLVDANYTAQDYADAVTEHIESRLPMLRKTPVVAMSSLNGHNVQTLMPVVFDARDRWARKLGTGVLNRWLAEVVIQQAPPMHQGRPTRIKYILQTKGRPPTFLLYCNVPELPVSYVRYLTRHFQDSFEYFGMEVRIAVKKVTENPYSAKSRRSGSGLGGKEARKQRTIKLLKTTGQAKLQRRRKPTR